MTGGKAGQRGKWPLHGWIGLILIALFWTLNWTLTGTRTHWGFFPLWCGYGLTVDALAFRKKGHSLLTRRPGVWACLFLASAPAWWLFEGINLRTQNWIYLGKESFSTFEYAAFATLSFSTVMPAVFGTAEWVGSWKGVQRFGHGPIIPKRRATLRLLTALGVVMLFLLLAWPNLFFPLVWGSLFCILEPVNARLGNRTLLSDLSRGDWRPAIALSIGCLICGFFWEMWNYYSWPKWIYRIPYADVFHLFEMPLAGYLGYIPFSLELFALYHFVMGLLRRDKGRNDLQL